MESSVIKSVERAFRVLELFQKHRKPMSATQIRNYLKLPNSSTNALLKSLVQLNYLSLDSQGKNYFPTLSLSKLGEWVVGAFFGSSEILDALKELHDQTQETVSLSIPNGLNMQFIVVIPGTFPISLNLHEGLMAPLFKTGVGIAQLSTRTDKEIAKLVNQANRRAGPEQAVELAKVMESVNEVRATGFSKAYDQAVSDTGAIAMPLPKAIYDPNLVIAVGGLWERIRSHEAKIVRIMRSALRRLQ